MYIYNSPVSFKGPATDALRRHGLDIGTADQEGFIRRISRLKDNKNLISLALQAADERLATVSHPYHRSKMEDLKRQLDRIA